MLVKEKALLLEAGPGHHALIKGDEAVLHVTGALAYMRCWSRTSLVSLVDKLEHWGVNVVDKHIVRLCSRPCTYGSQVN